jgi:hypothetical protein
MVNFMRPNVIAIVVLSAALLALVIGWLTAGAPM